MTFLLSFMGGGSSATLQNPYLIYIVAQYSFNMPCRIYFPLATIKGEPKLLFLRSKKKQTLLLFVCLFVLYFSLKLLHQKPLWFFSWALRRPSSNFFFLIRHHKGRLPFLVRARLCVRG